MYKKILVPMALDHDISPQTLSIAHALCAEDGEIVRRRALERSGGGRVAQHDHDDGGDCDAYERAAVTQHPNPSARRIGVQGDDIATRRH